MSKSPDSRTPHASELPTQAVDVLLDQLATCVECQRDGRDLLIKGADGRLTRLEGAWDLLRGNEAALSQVADQLRELADLLKFEGLWIQLAQTDAAGVATDASSSGQDAAPIGRLSSASEPAQVIRGGQPVTLQPGDGLLPGDVLQTSGTSQAKVELLSAQGAVVGQITAGANSKLSVTRQAGDNPLLSVKVESGALLVDKLNDALTPVRIDTPAGAVQPKNQSVGVNVSGQTGETTLVAMNVVSTSTGLATVTTAGGAAQALAIPTQGITLMPEQQRSSTTSTATSASSVQLDPIAKLLDTGTASASASAPGARTASPGDPFGNLGGGQNPNLQGVGFTSSAGTGLGGTGNGSASISGANLGAPFSGGSGGANTGVASASGADVASVSPMTVTGAGAAATITPQSLPIVPSVLMHLSN